MRFQRKVFVLIVALVFTYTVLKVYRRDIEYWYDLWTSSDECGIFYAEDDVNETHACVVPEIDPFHPSIMYYFEETVHPDCPGTTYGVLKNGTLNFTDSEVKSASYRQIRRDGDFTYKFGEKILVDSQKIMNEFVEVEYILKNGGRVKDLLYQVLPHQHLIDRKGKQKPGLPLNILIIGMDSLSLGNTRRNLPKVYRYLKENLNALFYKGHSIVGDGTTPQLTAMLTGKYISEHYEARTGYDGARNLDGWSFIYNDFKEHGYLTGDSGDGVYSGPFQFRLKGFENPPTDFYPRPFFLAAAEVARSTSNLCVNNRNICNLHLGYAKAVFDTFRNNLKFFLSFNAAYSHDKLNNVKKNERDVLSLLEYLKAKGHLRNTLLIVMGDHGLRYGPVRTTVQGKLEERLPLLSLVFPKQFRVKYPKLMKTLKANTERLTSWFDVHATLKHILSYPDLPKDVKRGVSLFSEISENRTCDEAGVPKHWCPCLEWQNVDSSHRHVQKAALKTVEYMNELIRANKNTAKLCRNMSLTAINFAQLERPNSKVDHNRAGRKSYRQIKEYFCRYQVQFVTSPNQGIFEATVKYDHYKQYTIGTGTISRLNLYGDQPQCIANEFPYLRKFCLCKNYNGTL